MYEYIQGKLVEATPAYAVVDCGGVGYMIEISVNTYSKIKDLKEVKLLTHYVVREDAHLLYGFAEADERAMFRLLISISGVGTSTARVMLSSLTVQELKVAIVDGDVRTIQHVKGIGAKTAQRVVLELRDKVGEVQGGTGNMIAASNKNAEEALSALTMLGFAKAAADKALQKLAKQMPEATVEELIKQALQIL